MLTMDQYIEKAKEYEASDIHVVCGSPVKARIHGQIETIDASPCTEEECHSMAREIAGPQYEELMERGELDLSAMIAGVRCRVHLFKQQGVPSLALRLFKEKIPELYDLGLPPAVMEITRLQQGIVLVTGETGSGKSTTLAAILNTLNHSRKKHIITLEDPIEYIYTPDKCLINQREVGRDTRSFSEGLRASLREDPDIILIGEMRDKDTIETALIAAETGHLVFATLHSGSAVDSIDRIVQVFPDGMQNQIRVQLSTCLKAVLSQQLLPKIGGGRVLACELMFATDAVCNNIRKGNPSGIANAVSQSVSIGGQSMDYALEQLMNNRKISKETAVLHMKDKSRASSAGF